MGENPALSSQLSIGLSGRCSLDSTPSFASFCRSQLVIAPRFKQPETREGLYLVLCGPTTQCWSPTQARTPNPTILTPSPSGVFASGSEGGRDAPVVRFLCTIVANITALYIRISEVDFEHSETQSCIGGTLPVGSREAEWALHPRSTHKANVIQEKAAPLLGPSGHVYLCLKVSNGEISGISHRLMVENKYP